ncbi:MAG TPA: flagellar motor switch protein FliM [Geobacteraceae bacterium]|nr:flagellar motor switch protein FliM [Geobacteraceae bacterium]
MEKTLTREEIDALLEAIFDGRIEPEKELANENDRVSIYDLFNTEHNVLVPNLDVIYDSFIRYNRVTLSNRLRKIVEIKKLGAQMYKFDEFLQTLPSPVCMAIYKIDPLKGAALISMDSNLVFTLVDCILGGTGAPNIPENNRMFTSIELRLMEKIVKDVLGDMEKAWTHIQATNMHLLRMEMNPRLVTIVPPEYQIITMSLEILIEEFKGEMVFAIPYMTIEPIRDKLKSGTQLDVMAVDPQWSNRLSSGLLDAPLELTVEMGRSTITLGELMELVPGDTIMLDRDIRSDLTVMVEGADKFLALPGTRSGNKAVQITEILELIRK